MADILPFKKKSTWQKRKGNTLCKEGFHKWKVVTANQFDVKQGRLVTRYRCERCGESKVKAH